MVPFLYWFVARRSPGRWQIVGAIIATIGLGALSLQGDFTLSWGDAITLLGTLFYALHIMTTGFFAPKVRPTTLALTQMAVSTADPGRRHALHRPHHARPAVAGLGRGRLDGAERDHLRVLHPELGAALHDLHARRHPARVRERVRGIAGIIAGMDSVTWRLLVGGSLMLTGVFIVELLPSSKGVVDEIEAEREGRAR